MAKNSAQRKTGRTARTRAWIIEAFNRLVLSRKYEELSVSDVVSRAGVGRSTFYEHFEHKDEVLRSAVSVVLAPLAQCVADGADLVRVRGVVDHVSERSGATLEMLAGPAREEVARALAELIGAKLKHTHGARAPLVAAQIAGAQLGLLRHWLGTAPRACDGAELAAMLRDTTRAMAEASRNPPRNAR